MNSQFSKILPFGIEICCRFINQASGRNKILLTSSYLRHYNNYPSCTYLVVFNSQCFVINNVNTRLYGTSVRDSNTTREEKEKANKSKARSKKPATILLITETDNLSAVSLEEAGRMAKKSGLHLIEVDGSKENLKTTKQVYRLISNEQFYGEPIKKQRKDSGDSKKKEKEDKTLVLKSKTSAHDVLVKVKNIKKWVEKGHSVNIFIGAAGDNQNSEAIYKMIEDSIKGEPFRICQKVVKSSQIRFQIIPPKATTLKEFANELKNKEIRNAKKLEKDAEEEDHGDDDDDDDDDDDGSKNKKSKSSHL